MSVLGLADASGGPSLPYAEAQPQAHLLKCGREAPATEKQLSAVAPR
jgi:hypothetical protein